MTPIHAVPSEVLSTIFRFALGQPPLRPNTMELLAHHQTCIRIIIQLSLVCKKWRSAVVGDGTLWTTLPVHSSRPHCHELTRTVLERSKHAVLDVSIVCMGDPNSPSEAIFSKICQNFDRIRSLHFVTTSSTTLRHLSLPASKLETLNIFTAEQPVEFKYLFGGNLPALRSLTLAGFPSWPIGLFSNLKDMCLVLPPSYPTVMISTLIDVMSRSPGIEQIDISAFLSMINDSPPSCLVRLQNLQKFTMRDCDSATILSHTVIPAMANVKIVMDHRRIKSRMHIASRDCHILCSIPEDMSTLKFSVESTVLVLQQDERMGFGVGFYRSRSSQPSLRILDRSAPVKSFARRSVEALANRSHHFGSIVELCIALLPGTIASWSRILRCFERIQRVSTVAPHAPSILSALMVVGEDGHPICPSLGQLTIHEKDNDHAVTLDDEDVIRFLAVRKELGCAATEVDIHWQRGRKRWRRGDDQTAADC